uniref:alpha/beta fold hydrolase n=1 Tax=Halomonas sp. TaxID=1486246 RepID=UPI00262D1AE7|nr:alpha/beta fold hydrolase [Halomonas sp.]
MARLNPQQSCPPLLMLPGMMCDARLFTPQIAALSAGRSLMVPDLSGEKSIAALAEKILDEAPPRFALAGLSMGGIVAMEMLAQQPERVAGIALMNTNPRAELPEVRAGRGPQIEAAHQGQMLALMEERMFPLYSASGDPSISAIARDMAASLGPEAFIRQSLALRDREDLSDVLQRSHIPTLILGGHNDLLCPPERHEYMASLMPHAKLVMLAETAHLSTLERPVETSAALNEWLETLHD